MNRIAIKEFINQRNRLLINIGFLILLFNFLIENFIFYFESRDVIISAQILVNILYFILILNLKKYITFPITSSLIIFIAGYLLFLSLFSTNLLDSFNKSFKFLLPLSYVIVGYNILTNSSEILYFINKLWYILIIFIASILYANLFQIGDSLYREGILIGFASINSLYTVTFIWITLLFFIKEAKLSKFVSILLLISVAIILILILKRTLLLLVAMSFFFYLIQNLHLKKIIVSAIVLFFGFLIFQFYFSSYFYESLNTRSSRFSEEYSVADEGRFQENILPFLEMKSNPVKYVFGTGEVFNDRPYSLYYLKMDRELHNSFVRLFWSGGLIILFAFLYFYYKQYKILLKGKRFFSQNNFYKGFFYFGLIFVLLRFISEFSSGITYISYNLFSYLIIGGLFSLASNSLHFKNN
jgi:hypothetical protein